MVGKCWPNLRVLCLGGVEVDVKGLVSVGKDAIKVMVPSDFKVSYLDLKYI